ncbi:MAG: hypothetical protein V1707_01200 [bacterium]
MYTFNVGTFINRAMITGYEYRLELLPTSLLDRITRTKSPCSVKYQKQKGKALKLASANLSATDTSLDSCFGETATDSSSNAKNGSLPSILPHWSRWKIGPTES